MADEDAPKKKNWFAKHKVLTVVLVLVVLAIIGSASGGSNNNKPASSSSDKSASSSNASASSADQKIGQPANDGKFTFTVNKFSCGIPEVGSNPYAQATAQGQYCDLNLTVKNSGTESQDLMDSNQYVYDSAGKKYSADSSADIDASASTSGGTWMDSINPGNSVTGDIYFDVPKGTTPISAELHDSAFSGGVKVNLQ